MNTPEFIACMTAALIAAKVAEKVWCAAIAGARERNASRLVGHCKICGGAPRSKYKGDGIVEVTITCDCLARIAQEENK